MSTTFHITQQQPDSETHSIMAKLIWAISPVALLVPLSAAQNLMATNTENYNSPLGTHCPQVAAATEAYGSCALSYTAVQTNCVSSLHPNNADSATALIDTECICSYYLAASPCASAWCDQTGYSIYVDNFSRCVRDLGTGGKPTPAPTTPGTGSPAVTTPPPTGTGTAAGSQSTSTKSSAGSSSLPLFYSSLLAAGFVGAVAFCL
ncbi:hypothetical protein B0T24DRAFT_690454 [Lasiosphaeria ovina]|uniref:Extracellular membrane protein CFEM domain-containing protein n=1 Tax=Lasiosphaeria ovina TaxID=92902 RepID=A0AAE0MZB5_9PEZI|nr:hypothetical protein B0T24DRAFT_690454 [Lasiosphaeria ovina]